MPHSVKQKAEASPSTEVEMTQPATNEVADQPMHEDVDMADANSQTQGPDTAQDEDSDVEISNKGPERSGTANGAAGVKLEDLFDMGSDDDEFPSSAAPAKKETPNSPDLLPSSSP